jgi:hypothetical protein
VTRWIGATAVALLLLCAQAAPAGAPDLRVSSVGPDGAYPFFFPGASVTVTVITANAGTGAAGPSFDRLYMSHDKRVSRGDIRVLVWHVPGLPAGASRKQRKRFSVEEGSPGSTYWLIACADARKNVAESNERNNCRASERAYAIPIID